MSCSSHRNRLASCLILLSLLLVAGCTPGGRAAKAKQKASAIDDHGHTHERGKMLLADAGKYHALLTAHLAKEGNELDIFFETTSKQPVPVALPLEQFSAQIKADEETKEVVFEPAPADERPKDEKAGTASHFVAKVPWMKPTDTLYVVVKIMIDGSETTIRWQNFNPKKYAHHDEP